MVGGVVVVVAVAGLLFWSETNKGTNNTNNKIMADVTELKMEDDC